MDLLHEMRARLADVERDLRRLSESPALGAHARRKVNLLLVSCKDAERRLEASATKDALAGAMADVHGFVEAATRFLADAQSLKGKGAGPEGFEPSSQAPQA